MPEDNGPGEGSVDPNIPNITTYGPISYLGFYIFIFEVRPIFERPVLPGLPNPQTTQWIGQVHKSQDPRSNSEFRTSGSSYDENLDLCKAWIESVNLGVTPGTETDVVEGDLTEQYYSYGECIKIGTDLGIMDFVKSSRENLARRFQTDSTKSEFLDFGPLPMGFYAKITMKILAVDDSLPAGTRKSNYEEVVKITLEEGDYMSVQSSGNDNISISIMKNGSERIDPFSIMRLRSGYTKTQVTVTLDELYDCLAKPEFEPHIMYDCSTGEGFQANTQEDHEKYAALGYVHDLSECDSNGNGDDSPILEKEQMFVILGFLVLIIVGGWILSTTTEGGE